MEPIQVHLDFVIQDPLATAYFLGVFTVGVFQSWVSIQMALHRKFGAFRHIFFPWFENVFENGDVYPSGSYSSVGFVPYSLSRLSSLDQGERIKKMCWYTLWNMLFWPVRTVWILSWLLLLIFAVVLWRILSNPVAFLSRLVVLLLGGFVKKLARR